MKLTIPYWLSILRWSESLRCSIDGIRWWRTCESARRMWPAEYRAERIAGNVECARIAWAQLNRAVRLLLADAA